DQADAKPSTSGTAPTTPGSSSVMPSASAASAAGVVGRARTRLYGAVRRAAPTTSPASRATHPRTSLYTSGWSRVKDAIPSTRLWRASSSSRSPPTRSRNVAAPPVTSTSTARSYGRRGRRCTWDEDGADSTLRDAATADRRAPRAPAGTPARDPRAGLRACTPLSAGVRRRRCPARGPRLARRPRALPVHGEGRPPRELPVRNVRRAARGGRPHPRIVRDDGPADRRRVHAARRRHLGGARGALARVGGRPTRRRRAHRLRLRPLHRRARLPLRRGAPRLHGHPRLRRHDRAAGAADRGLPAAGDHGDALVLPGDRGRDGARGAR